MNTPDDALDGMRLLELSVAFLPDMARDHMLGEIRLKQEDSSSK